MRIDNSMLRLMFCSIFWRSRSYCYSSCHLVWEKVLKIFFFELFCGAIIFETKWIVQNLGIEKTIQHYRKNRKIVRNTFTNVFLNFNSTKSVWMLKSLIYTCQISVFQLKSRKTTFLNKISWVYYLKYANSNDLCFHYPLQCAIQIILVEC